MQYDFCVSYMFTGAIEFLDFLGVYDTVLIGED